MSGLGTLLAATLLGLLQMLLAATALAEQDRLLARLPPQVARRQRWLARAALGVLALAALLGLHLLLGMDQALLPIGGFALSARDLALLLGGLFLLSNAAAAIHGLLHSQRPAKAPADSASPRQVRRALWMIALVASLDLAFLAPALTTWGLAVPIATAAALLAALVCGPRLAPALQGGPAAILVQGAVLLVALALVAAGLHRPVQQPLLQLASAVLLAAAAVILLARRPSA